jgi:hypothetical protein
MFQGDHGGTQKRAWCSSQLEKKKMTKICVSKNGRRWHRIRITTTRSVAEVIKEARLRGLRVKLGLA